MGEGKARSPAPAGGKAHRSVPRSPHKSARCGGGAAPLHFFCRNLSALGFFKKHRAKCRPGGSSPSCGAPGWEGASDAAHLTAPVAPATTLSRNCGALRWGTRAGNPAPGRIHAVSPAVTLRHRSGHVPASFVAARSRFKHRSPPSAAADAGRRREAGGIFGSFPPVFRAALLFCHCHLFTFCLVTFAPARPSATKFRPPLAKSRAQRYN